MPLHTDIKAVGRILREARERRGWLQSDLGAVIHRNQQHISKLEHGQITSPDIRELVGLATALELPLEELLAPFSAPRPNGRRRPQLTQVAS